MIDYLTKLFQIQNLFSDERYGKAPMNVIDIKGGGRDLLKYSIKASGITEGRGDMFLRNVGYLPIKRHTKLQPKRPTLKSSPLLEFQISNSLP